MATNNMKKFNANIQQTASEVKTTDSQGIPTLAQTITDTIATFKVKKTELTLQKDTLKKAQKNTKDIQGDIEIIFKHISNLETLQSLETLKNYTTTQQFFTSINKNHELGQYKGFDVDYSIRLLNVPENADYSSNFETMQKTLNIINQLINLFEDSNVYNDIFKEAPSLWSNDNITINFKPIKDLLSDFLEKNSDTFSTNRVTIK